VNLRLLGGLCFSRLTASLENAPRYTSQKAPMGNLSAQIVRTVVIAAIVVSLAWVVPSFPAGQSSSTSAPKTKVCQLLPTTELETTYRGKVTNPHGFDGESSICTANIGEVAIKLQSVAPGTRGVPTSISQGLVGARMMLGQAKQKPESNTKDFGNVGCMSMKMTKGFDGKSLAKRLLTTSCFLVDGGYLNVTIAGNDGKHVGFETVKLLLEKAAARR